MLFLAILPYGMVPHACGPTAAKRCPEEIKSATIDSTVLTSYGKFKHIQIQRASHIKEGQFARAAVWCNEVDVALEEQEEEGEEEEDTRADTARIDSLTRVRILVY